MKKKLFITSLILSFFIGISYALLATTAGLRTSLKLMSALLPGQLQVEQAEGSLWQRFALKQVVYKAPTYQIQLQQLHIHWQSWKLLSGRLAIKELKLEQIQFYKRAKFQPQLMGKAQQVHLNSELGLRAKHPLNLVLSWQAAELWLNNQQQLHDGQGQLSVQGNREHYQWQLHTQLPGSQLPSSIWQLIGQGSTQHLILDAATIELLDGSIEAQGQLNWQQPLNWQLNLQAKQLNPSKLWPNMPGKINFKALSQGHYDKQLTLDIALSELHGNLHHQPLAGDATLHLQGEALYLEHVELSAGDAWLNIAGHIKEDWDLHWHLNLPRLDQLLTHSDGKIYTQGTISGLRHHPIINSHWEVQQFRLENYAIQSIKANGKISLDNDQPSQFQLLAKQLQLNTLNINHLQLDLTGQLAQQQLSATLTTPKERYLLQANSHYLDRKWQIQIPLLSAYSQRFNTWQLNTPIHIELDKQQGTIEPFCWQASSQKICLNHMAWQNKQNWQAALQGQHLDLKLLNLWLPKTLNLSGHVDFKLAADNQGGITQAQTNLAIGIAQLSYTTAQHPPQNLLIHDLNASAILDKKGLQANLQALVLDQPLLARLELPDYQALGMPEPNQALSGQLSFNINDIAILGAIIPNTTEITGKLQLNLKLAGTVTKPELDGKAVLKQGGFTLPAYNARAEQIQGTITGQTDGQVSYQLTGRAGPDSHLILRGQADLFAQPLQSKTRLTGTHATIVNTDQYQILADPEVELLTQGTHLTLNGTVYIPQANITPTDFSPGVVELPEELVIIGGPQKHTASTVPFSMQLKLKLGQQVKVDSKGLFGRIEGHTDLYLQPQHPLTASGQLNILDGNYKIYGENLTIRTGRLIYGGGPIDNPGLNIQAVRTIKTSLLDQLTVGVNVQGRLKQPRVNLFSEPVSLNQSDILSYLLTGAPISQVSEAKGQLLFKAATMLNPTGDKGIGNLKKELQNNLGLDELDVGTLQQYSGEKGAMVQNTSLMLGKQLTPRLHLGYSVGITEHINTFSLRYLLWRRLLLQTQTTGESSGIDLIYTVER